VPGRGVCIASLPFPLSSLLSSGWRRETVGTALAALLLVAPLLALSSTAAMAGDGWKTISRDSQVRQASYSSGQNGSKLKWLPYRPSIPADGDTVLSTQYVQPRPTIPELPTAQREASGPFSDPFGDRNRLLQEPGILQEGSLKSEATAPGMTVPAPNAFGTPPQSSSADSLPPLEPGSIAEPGMPPALDLGIPPREDAGTEQQRALDRSLAQRGQVDLLDKCPSPKDLKPIGELTIDTKAEDGDFPPECNLGDDAFAPRAWTPTCYTWKASGLCHKPLYFEDVHLERYGHSWGPYLQPVISGAHFFVTIPAVPYKMGLTPPAECMYTLGYYRPGSCAPYMLDPLPLSIRAALFEAGAWVGMVAAIP